MWRETVERLIYKELIKWKNDPLRKPMVLQGARQVGKTWILKEFGKNEFHNMLYLNCDSNPSAAELFADYDIPRILRVMSAITNQRIYPEKTLIVLDEIQEAPRGITALKYFQENAPQYPVAVAGFLLGMEVHNGTGFPVGKTDELKLYPMSFTEFLLALDKAETVAYLREHRWDAYGALSAPLTELLRQYYYTGGMPEVVDTYVRTGDLRRVRRVQKRILGGYEKDFSKHAPADQVPKIHAVWESVPAQLAKENKKFMYSALKKGARAKKYERAVL